MEVKELGEELEEISSGGCEREETRSLKIRNPGTRRKWKSQRELVPLKRNKAASVIHLASVQAQ